MTPTTFSDCADFLARGLELAECSICREPFDVAHLPYQIRECGHVFGKVCLEAWLNQSGTQGTCPQCRSILFGADPEPELAEETLQRFQLARRTIRGYMLRVLNVHDAAGLLVLLWKEMTIAFEPDARETYENAWTPRIIGLIRYLLEGLGLSNHDQEREALAQEVRETNALELALYAEQEVIPFGYQPINDLARNMIKISRIFPRRVIPDPILWRAIICLHNSSGPDITDCCFQDDKDWMFDLPDLYDWGHLAAGLYFLLVLMAQDTKHNLRSNDDYNVEDVKSLLRVIHAQVMYDDYLELDSDNISRDYCERVVRFHHIAQINNPRTVPSQEVADPHTDEELVLSHVRDFWLSSRGSWTVETPYGGERT